MFKKCENPIVEELTKSFKERQFTLSSLKVIKIDGIRYCVWCTKGVLTHGSQKYCSTECSRSAMAWSYPQKEENLALILIRQDYKCNICKFDYAPFMDQIAEKDRNGKHDHYMTNETDWRTKYIWYYYKRLKDRVPPERKPEVDHIIPIFKGGTSLGCDNHQVICYSCHKIKTSFDLKKS